MYRAHRQTSSIIIGAAISIALVTLWALRHVARLIASLHGHQASFAVIYGLSFAVLFWQVLLYCLERPYRTTAAEQAVLDRKRVIVNVPVCNEDETALKNGITSLLMQTRPVDIIHVVVNGPNKIDYEPVRQELAAQTVGHTKTRVIWTTQAIAGKRQAQATTAREYLERGDIFMTVDSDGYVDANAVAEGLKPFANRDVESVAGVILVMNMKSWIAKLTDLWMVTGQLVDRSAYSTMGSVLVNSGALAFYRSGVILDNLETYTTEEFFGHHVEFSDDSLLTVFALERGRAVQQPTAFTFTLMPETLHHHFRQQVRWARGAFIRSWWRFKYLPLDGYAYWGHFVGWCLTLLSSIFFGYLFVFMPVIEHQLIPWLLLIPLLVGYGHGLRYLTVWRSDRSWWQQFGMFLLDPIPGLWMMFVLRFVKIYGMITCVKTQWGTRVAGIEVGVETTA